MVTTLQAIDQVPVDREESPCSPEELSRILRSAYDSETTVIPVGGGTKLRLGNPPRSAQLAVRTSRLRGIVEYEPDNMTVSVLAGTPLQDVQDVLRTGKQFLPIDPPHPAAATVGGLVACNTSGPIRFRYGTIRDVLLGIKIAHADGTLTKAGGKLVKNVTGYDMCKLYTGSLGTLGIFTELTFKIQPWPETLATMLLAYSSTQAALEATQSFLRNDLLPDAMEIWNGAAFEAFWRIASPSLWILMIRFGDVAPAVEWQTRRVTEALSAAGGEIVRVSDSSESESLWQKASSAREASDGQDEAIVKCSVLYQSMAETVRQMEEMGKRLAARSSLYCHAGTSVIYGHYQWTSAGPPAKKLREEFTALRLHCVSQGGHMVVERVRSEVKNGFDVWGYDAPALEVMRRIKHEFDPKSLLNPGRFVGGI